MKKIAVAVLTVIAALAACVFVGACAYNKKQWPEETAGEYGLTYIEQYTEDEKDFSYSVDDAIRTDEMKIVLEEDGTVNYPMSSDAYGGAWWLYGDELTVNIFETSGVLCCKSAVNNGIFTLEIVRNVTINGSPQKITSVQTYKKL